MPGRVASEEDAVLGRLAQGMGDPVALVADGVGAQILGQSHRRFAYVEPRIKRADADPQLTRGGKAPPVAGGHVPPVDPHLEVIPGAMRMDLEPARQERVGRLDVAAPAEHPPPAKPVDDQGGADVAPVGVHGVSAATVDLRSLEFELALLGQEFAQPAVVEGGERPGQVVADAGVGGVDDELAEGLLAGGEEVERLEPEGGDPAGRGLALTDLIAVDQHHLGSGAGELPGHGQASEAGSADQHVAVGRELRALRASLGGSDRHGRVDDTEPPRARSAAILRRTLCPPQPL